MQSRSILVSAGALVVAAGLAFGQDAAKVERGKAVYAEQKCKLCHSIAGEGNAKGPLDGIGSKLSADEIKHWLTNPKEMSDKVKAERKPPMKAYPNLSPADQDALVAYILSLKK
jgi:mono/diheme cytochrome c family protein